MIRIATFGARLALAFAVLGAACPQPASAALDVGALREHGRGRALALQGDLDGAREAWDAALRRAGTLAAVVVSKPCGAAALAAELRALRGVSPVWVLPGEGPDCHVVVWGAFASAEDAQAQAGLLSPVPSGSAAEVVLLSAPLGGSRRALPSGAASGPSPQPNPVPVERLPTRSPPAPVAAPPQATPEPDMPQRQTPPRASEPPAAATVHASPPSPPRPDGLAPPPTQAEDQPATELPPRPVAGPPVSPRAPVEGDTPLGLFAEGNAAYARGDYDEAIRSFEASIALDPANPRTRNNLGTAWLLKGDAVWAEAAFRKALELDPNYARAILNLSSALYAQARMEEAEAGLRRVLALEPTSVDAFHNLATLLVELRRWEEARDTLERGLLVLPDNPRLKSALTQVEGQIGVRTATAAPSGAARPAPPAPPAPPARTGQAPEAAKSPCGASLGTAQRARLASRHFSDGRAAYERKDHRRAAEEFEQALDCDPTSVAVLNHLGAARLAGGDPEGALAAFDLALALEPDQADAATNRGFALFDLGRCDEAVAQLERGAGEAPPSAGRSFDLGRVLYRCGRVTEAQTALQAAVAADPGDDRARRLLERIAAERLSVP